MATRVLSLYCTRSRARATYNYQLSHPPPSSLTLYPLRPPRPTSKIMLASTGYSTLFSLGLSSIHTSFPYDIDAGPSSSATNHLSCSATPDTPSSAAAQFALSKDHVHPPKIHINTQVSPARPRIRRRRSSVTAAQSPLANIGVKSPAPRPRTTPSPARNRHRRSESDAVSRIRSNSLGDGLRYVCIPFFGHWFYLFAVYLFF